MVDARSSRLPLQDLSNGYSVTASSTNTSGRPVEKPPVQPSANRFKRPRTSVHRRDTMASSLLQNAAAGSAASSSTEVQMEDIVKLKQGKQNDLSSLNSEIWKVQTQIADMELKLDELASKASIVRSDFQSLEDKLKNLQAVKNHKIQRLNDSLAVFRSTLDRSFDEKVARLSQTYDEKVTNIINSKHLEFKEKERSLSDKIIVLRNSLADYSDKILEESKTKISKDAET